MSIAVVTDTSAQLDARTAERLGVRLVPIGIVHEGEEHEEPALDVEWFYEQLATGASVSTSLPSPGRLAEAYEAAAAGGASEALSIHLDGRVSGTVTAAHVAAGRASIPVTVVDARTVSFGVGVCAIAAARSVEAGLGVVEIREMLERLGRALENAFVAPVSTGGRVPATTGVSLLSFANGAVRTLGPCAALEAAPAAILSHLPDRGALRAAVGHAHGALAGLADELAQRLAARPNVVDVRRYRVSPSVGAHTGPLSFGAFWWPARLYP